jgi:chromate transporter
MMKSSDTADAATPRTDVAAQGGSAFEVLRTFTRLGVTSFGGPIAHLGYFRTEFVERRQWLSERAYADLVGLCQFLPGPASSKLGFSLGLLRAGYPGGLAAWVGFTLPSALLLFLFAYGAGELSHSIAGQGLLHGLKLVAVAVVAQAVSGMARTLCPDRSRASIGVAAALVALLAPTAIGQIAAIALGAVAGLLVCRSELESVPEPLRFPLSRTSGTVSFIVFALLLAVSFWPFGDTLYGMFNAFYRSGALVFGGGHVVLPLLNEAVVQPGWVARESFLAGYGAAQAVPGPLFTFAAYLGAVMQAPGGGVSGAALALVAIFLPGLLLQMAALPFWNAFRGKPAAQAAMRGVNAAVVGILAAALYTPVWTSAVLRPGDFAVALAGFVLLTVWKLQPFLVALIMAGAGVLLAVSMG